MRIDPGRMGLDSLPSLEALDRIKGLDFDILFFSPLSTFTP
jgi:hypothetical protein